MIELKYYGHDQNLEQRVIDIVEILNMADEVAIMSLKLAGIEKLKALRPDWQVGLLAAKSVGDLTRLEIDFLALNAGLVTPGLLRRAHRQGKEVLVWTVNDPVSMSRFISLGVDGIITDEPALAREVLAQREKLNLVERLLIQAAPLFGLPPPIKAYRDSSP
jgi:glycerophosphoryl diester phosphodiesterase